MAKILSVETSPYYEKQIEIYAKNKVGQYSKYLDKNPTFVEYYHINRVLSRADAGSQSVKEEIGRNSPIRFNKIKDFPIYGLSELKPDLTYDENGLDMELDLSGLIILPGTIHPTPGDYFYFKFPGMSVGILWRVTNKEFNTVQANDYYQINAEMYSTAKDTEKHSSYQELQKQVVEDYTCIFDNIGTNDACIVKNDQYIQAQYLGTYITNLMNNYYEVFYHRDVGTFVGLGMWNETPTYLYDMYLIKFMKEVDLWDIENGTDRIVALTYDDIMPSGFEAMYRKSLWYALQKKSTQFMGKYQYYYTYECVKQSSPLLMYSDRYCESVHLKIDEKVDDYLSRRIIGGTKEYFTSDLTRGILEGGLKIKDERNQLIYDYLTSNDITLNLGMLDDLFFDMTSDDYIYGPALLFILKKCYNAVFNNAGDLTVTLVGGPGATGKDTDDMTATKYIQDTVVPAMNDMKTKLAQMDAEKLNYAYLNNVGQQVEFPMFKKNIVLKKITISGVYDMRCSGFKLTYKNKDIYRNEDMGDVKRGEDYVTDLYLPIDCISNTPITLTFLKYSQGTVNVYVEYAYQNDGSGETTNLI